MRWEFRVLSPEDKESFSSLERLQSFLADWGLRPEEYEIIRSASYTFRSCIAPQWTQGRISLCGDACHTMPPFMGQGMNQGFKDAANLCWKVASIARGEASLNLLDTYGEERYGRVLGMVERSVQIGKMISAFCQAELDANQHAVVEKYRDAGYVGVQGSSFVKNACGQVVPDSRFCMAQADPRLLPETNSLAGHWLWQPVEELETTDGRAGRLDDLIGGYRFALLARGDDPLADLSEDASEYLRTLGAAIVPLQRSSCDRVFCLPDDDMGTNPDGQAAFVLVRPDRIVFGSCTKSADVDRLVAALKDCLQQGGF